MRESLARTSGRLLAAAAGALALAAGLLTAAPQHAASAAEPAPSAADLTEITGFGSNPGNLSMYAYVPDGLPADAPVVVALHGCTQNARDYYDHSGWPELADRHGFAVVLPQTSSANNLNSCFNWFKPGDTARDSGEALSIKQMVDKAVTEFGADADRIHVTGLSAGGGMTANLLAAYPDVFAGGAVNAGLPAYCANNVATAYTCMYSPADKSPTEWGDSVRAAAPEGTTEWPRVAIWQGTADTTVRPANADELRDQWTDVWGLGQTPSRTADLPGGTTRSSYDDSAGRSAVEVYSISGMAHGLAVDPGDGTEQCGTAGTYYLDTICSSHHTAAFWGLIPTGAGRDQSSPSRSPSVSR
ncbi:PHB depolymerase esterase [Streptomyces triticagri]|uniref:PHB depolymerase esterase n=1 Tax=Streptomyces triticagri TaxID=2293568 RepID=A0A372MB40_9ACTN|nr:PHB depolymerase family esterase [Streptomyces triticagri]RFU87830.1 PHB depolymerase esterase [Streptomyces triticagri]